MYGVMKPRGHSLTLHFWEVLDEPPRMECGGTVGPVMVKPHGDPLEVPCYDEDCDDCKCEDSQQLTQADPDVEIESPHSSDSSSPTDYRIYQIDHVPLDPSQKESLHREMAHECLHSDVPCLLSACLLFTFHENGQPTCSGSVVKLPQVPRGLKRHMSKIWEDAPPAVDLKVPEDQKEKRKKKKKNKAKAKKTKDKKVKETAGAVLIALAMAVVLTAGHAGAASASSRPDVRVRTPDSTAGPSLRQ